MGLLTDIGTLISECGSNAVLRERLLLLRDQLENVNKKIIRLEEENANLVKENGRLTGDLKKATAPKDFIEHRGVFFRRLPSGNLEEGIYCPGCKIPMVSFQGMFPFTCSH